MMVNKNYREEGLTGYYFLHFTPDDIELIDEILAFIAESKIIDLSIDKSVELPHKTYRQVKVLKKFKNQTIYLEIVYHSYAGSSKIMSSLQHELVIKDGEAIIKHIESIINMFESNR